MRMMRYLLFMSLLFILPLAACGKIQTEIIHTAYLRNTDDTTGPYRVMALVVSDAQPLKVYVIYSTDNWQSKKQVEMQKVSEDVFAGEIPGQQAGTTVQYYIWVKDAEENVATDPISLSASPPQAGRKDLTYRFQIIK